MIAMVRLASAALLVLSADPPSCERRSTDRGDYVMHLTALGPGGKPIHREVVCTVVGYAGDKVITITDTKTGDTRPYENHVTETTPVDLTVKNHAAAERIEVVCTMVGQPGDSLDCETVTAGRRERPAPLFGGKDFDLIQRGERSATCSANINAGA